MKYKKALKIAATGTFLLPGLLLAPTALANEISQNEFKVSNTIMANEKFGFSPMLENVTDLGIKPFAVNGDNDNLVVVDNIVNPGNFPVDEDKEYYPLRIYSDLTNDYFFTVSYSKVGQKLKVTYFKYDQSTKVYNKVDSKILNPDEKVVFVNREFGFKPTGLHYWFRTMETGYGLMIKYDWGNNIKGSPLDPIYVHTDNGYSKPPDVFIPGKVQIDIDIKDYLGKPVKDAKGTILKNESYSIFHGQQYTYDRDSLPIIPGYTLNKPENETGTITDENTKSKTVNYIYQFDAAGHKPVIDNLFEKDTQINGSGIPGDDIVILDANGNELGRGIVGSDGKFKIDSTRPLNPNEKITATPSTGTGTDKKVGVTADTTVAQKAKTETPGQIEIKPGDNGDATVKPTKPNGETYPEGMEVTIPGVKDPIVIGKDGTGTIPNDQLPKEETVGKGQVTEPGKNPSGKVDATTPAQKAKTETPGQIEIKPGDNGDATVKRTKPNGETYPEGTEVTIPGVKDPIVIGKDGTGTVPNDQLPKEETVGKGQVTEPGKNPSGKVDATTPAQKEFDKDKHKPKVDTPTEGNPIGEGMINPEGKFEITTDRPLLPGETVTVTPSTNGKEGTPTEVTVSEIPFDKDEHQPNINQPTEGDKVVTGTGISGDKIVLTDNGGNIIGEGRVDSNGKFEILTNRPLLPKEVITGTPSLDGKEGTPNNVTVLENPFDGDKHKPKVDQPIEEEQVVTGTGEPGDKIVITDKEGNPIGEGEVGTDGAFEVVLDRPLLPNEVITITPSIDGKEGTPTEVTVTEKPFDGDKHQPNINQPTEGEQVVTGTGEPGDKIVITDKEGNPIGEGEVGSDGKFEVSINRPLLPNEVITGTPSTDGKVGTPTKVTVTEKPFDKDKHQPNINQPIEGEQVVTVTEKPFDKDKHKPSINQPAEGDKVVTGTGQPGDKIVITDKEGKVIGEGEVGPDGKFEVSINRPLLPNEVITGTPSTDGKAGTPNNVTVSEKPFDKDKHKPSIKQPTEGDKVVTGTGQPGDKIVITDKEGKVIGEGEVGPDGKFEVTLNRPLLPNEVITITPSTNGKKGTPTEVTVSKKTGSGVVTDTSKGNNSNSSGNGNTGTTTKPTSGRGLLPKTGSNPFEALMMSMIGMGALFMSLFGFKKAKKDK